MAAQAQRAAGNLQTAVEALDKAREARDRVQALTQTITAYEEGLTALRESLRQASIREATLLLQFEAKRDRVAQLVGVLSRMEADPAPFCCSTLGAAGHGAVGDDDRRCHPRPAGRG
ncbi:hypothetical protein ACFSHQ_22115 [Gemmobacter lanyuensis]